MFIREQFSLVLSKVVENDLEVPLWANSAARPKVSAVNIIFTTGSWSGFSERNALSPLAMYVSLLGASVKWFECPATASLPNTQSKLVKTASARSRDRGKHAHHYHHFIIKIINYYLFIDILLLQYVYIIF